MADEFILLDDVQYTNRDWRNRNLIKTPKGPKWLTIPLRADLNRKVLINQKTAVDDRWRKQHWDNLLTSYSKARCFNSYAERIKCLYLKSSEKNLSKINYLFIKEFASILGIDTPILWSNDYLSTGQKSSKLVELCKAAGAKEYISGPAAKAYIDEELFQEAGIKIEWMSYENYPEYQQLYKPFMHQVSMIDLIFHEGPMATKFMKSFQ